jgi:phosphoesterase RecJ-like protein
MSETETLSKEAVIGRIGDELHARDRFLILSHVRPDGDAIGSMVALGSSLAAMGKTVWLVNEDGLPENLAFLPGSERVTPPPAEVLPADVVIALDCATKPRLGEAALHAASAASLWINIDHHISNPGYGDINLIDPSSPATGAILYDLLLHAGLPLTDEARDAIYVAVSTDTGSFQYPSTRAETYEMAADLIRRGLDVGEINSSTYDEQPFRRLELLRDLLNTLGRSEDGLLAWWDLRDEVRVRLGLLPEDSEGLIDNIRGIRGVRVAVFFEELPDGRMRVSMRSKDRRIDVCAIASQFGGGGHPMAAGIRMGGPFEVSKQAVLDAIRRRIAEAGIATANRYS